MKVSPWRLLHLWLAIVSSVFILIASITGVILAIEPVYQQSYGYERPEADELSVTDLIENTSVAYPEISSIRKDHNDYYQITIFDEEGESTFYVDPITGERLGELIKTPELFDFARVLHRSLYLKQTGRFIIGVTSLLLVFICIAGFVLVVRKQGGIVLYFNKVVKENFYQDYHTKLGKIFIWLILFVSITGTILFLERFDLLGEQTISHSFDSPQSDQPATSDFDVFESTPLSDFKELVFPFSDFDDDYFELKLEDKEYLINQKTGAVASEIDYSNGILISNFAFKWHTGEGQTWWAITLGISSVGLLFFIYSGFAIYFKRISSKSKWKNTFPKEQCELVVAVGSETGSTAEKASALHKALVKEGVKAFTVTLNDFEYFPSMKHLVVMTSTYGKGDAPSNASQFVKNFNSVKDQYAPFQYSVIGFGSRSYPDFCQYAVELDQFLEQHTSASRLLPLHKVEDGSLNGFEGWVQAVANKLNHELRVNDFLKKPTLVNLQVAKNTVSQNLEDQTFLMELTASNENLKDIQSGDLLAISGEDGILRYYSMSVDKSRKAILLSIKKHKEGKVSNHLSRLAVGSHVEASFKKNPIFHFPKKASGVLLIANGTGIAPFLGMLASNARKIPTMLFWGGKNETSLCLYKPYSDELKEDGKLEHFQTAYSRIENGAKYVQELLLQNESLVTSILKNQGVIMICGSLKMQEGVEKILNGIAEKNLNQPIGFFKDKKMVRADCY